MASLNFPHPSLLSSFHFSWKDGFLGSLILIDIMIVLWSVSFLPFILRLPSSSTVIILIYLDICWVIMM